MLLQLPKWRKPVRKERRAGITCPELGWRRCLVGELGRTLALPGGLLAGATCAVVPSRLLLQACLAAVDRITAAPDARLFRPVPGTL